MSGIKLEASNLSLLNEQQQNTLIADFGDLIRTINLPCKMIKTNVNYDFNHTIANFKQDKTTIKEEIKRELRDLSGLTGWKYDNLMFLQHQSLLVTYFWFNLISKATEIEMTCDTFATSFPIPDVPLKDKHGFLLAETISGKPVVWDLFKKIVNE